MFFLTTTCSDLWLGSVGSMTGVIQALASKRKRHWRETDRLYCQLAQLDSCNDARYTAAAVASFGAISRLLTKSYIAWKTSADPVTVKLISTNNGLNDSHFAKRYKIGLVIVVDSKDRFFTSCL